jgi:hypothetical protein
LEDRLRALENRKRHRSAGTVEQLERQLGSHEPVRSSNLPSPQDQQLGVRQSIELDDSDSSCSDTIQHRSKRQRYTRGIKVIPSYTLRISSSLREWGDWKRDIGRVFKGDPETYQRSSQKIIKALDYLDSGLKSLWYTYSEQKGDVRKWDWFLQWTRDNIQNGQNATATLYEQLNAAKQLPERSPIQFNTYLAAIERDLPQQSEAASAMTFYSKLSRELKKQFKTADIPIPETRAKCVTVAQRVWEGLHGTDEKKDTATRPSTGQSTSSKYSRPDSGRDRKDQYNLGHRSRDDQNKERPRNQSTNQPEVICYHCNKPGHYAPSCPERKESHTKAKIQSAQQEYRPSSVPNSQVSSRASTELPNQDEPNDSDDSLN